MGKSAAISDELLKRIRTGVYQERVPGERALADEFGVNFKTANRAVSALVDRGLLVRRRGEGTFVAGRKPRSSLTISLAFNKHTDPGSDPVFTRFFSGLIAEAKDQGCRTDTTMLRHVLDSAGIDPVKRASAARAAFAGAVLDANPDGVVLLGNPDDVVARRLAAGRPCLVVGDLPTRSKLDNVRRDTRAGVAEAVKLLADRGYERIAFATYTYADAPLDLSEKAAGYADGIAAAGMRYRKTLGVSFGRGSTVLSKLRALSPRPDAVVASESTLGVAITRSATEIGVTIPEDLALIAFDDGDLGEVISPTMSSIHAFGTDLGRLALKRLLERLDGVVDGRIDEAIPCRIIERASTAGRDTQ